MPDLTAAFPVFASSGLLTPGPEAEGSPCLELYQDIASYVLMASRRYKASSSSSLDDCSSANHLLRP